MLRSVETKDPIPRDRRDLAARHARVRRSLFYGVESVIDLDGHRLDFPCPRCKFFNTFTLGQVRLRDAVICRGCKATINLDDYMNETRKAIRSISRALRSLQEQLAEMGTITIRI